MRKTSVITCKNINFGKDKEIKLAPVDFSAAYMIMVWWMQVIDGFIDKEN